MISTLDFLFVDAYHRLSQTMTFDVLFYCWWYPKKSHSFHNIHIHDPRFCFSLFISVHIIEISTMHAFLVLSLKGTKVCHQNSQKNGAQQTALTPRFFDPHQKINLGLALFQRRMLFCKSKKSFSLLAVSNSSVIGPLLQRRQLTFHTISFRRTS